MVETTSRRSAVSSKFAARFGDQLHLPDTDGYAEHRTGYQRLAAHRPWRIVTVTSAEDVRDAVALAHEHDLRVTTQVSGHGIGHTLDDGVLLNTRRMSGVRIDPEARTAWVEAGATWTRVIEEADGYGLAPLSGSAPGVGAVPYTLGGGVGLLARRYGFAADHVRRFAVVTADGQQYEVSETQHPDLFWALRGGGGGFAVVTGMEIDLVPVHRFFGGSLYFDVEQVPEVLEAWRDWTTSVPEDVTSAVSVLVFPDLPVIPDDLRGRHVAQLQIAYLGSPAAGQELVRPLRAVGPSLRDTVRELPYRESASVFDEPDQPHAYLSDNRLLRDVDPAALATLPKLAGRSAHTMCVAGLRHLGGALAREPRVPNAVGNRDAGYMIGVLSPVADDGPAVRELHREVLDPWSSEAVGRALNFSFGTLTDAELETAFGTTRYRRLGQLKARYDPKNTLHSNQPIPLWTD